MKYLYGNKKQGESNKLIRNSGKFALIPKVGFEVKFEKREWIALRSTLLLRKLALSSWTNARTPQHISLVFWVHFGEKRDDKVN